MCNRLHNLLLFRQGENGTYFVVAFDGVAEQDLANLRHASVFAFCDQLYPGLELRRNADTQDMVLGSRFLCL